MAEIVEIGSIKIATSEILTMLANYQMLPQFIQSIIIEQAIADIECTAEEKTAAIQKFCEKNQITSEEVLSSWLDICGIAPEKFETVATKELKIEKFKLATWGNKVESYFLTRKAQLDKVIYSLLRTTDMGIAQELYFRLQEGEESFADLARQYSQGVEAQTGGVIGPVELSNPHPSIAKMLAAHQPGELCPLMRLNEWIVIVRCEKFMPATLDEAMRQRLLNELFGSWLQEELTKLGSIKNGGRGLPLHP
ncbi:MAG: peptidylprolyl isomerase [Crinalium sp.]